MTSRPTRRPPLSLLVPDCHSGLSFQEGRVPLDEQTHNIAIELCKECGDTSRAVDILRAMETAGVRERERERERG